MDNVSTLIVTNRLICARGDQNFCDVDFASMKSKTEWGVPSLRLGLHGFGHSFDKVPDNLERLIILGLREHSRMQSQITCQLISLYIHLLRALRHTSPVKPRINCLTIFLWSFGKNLQPWIFATVSSKLLI